MYELSWCNVGDSADIISLFISGERLKIKDPINLKKFF